MRYENVYIESFGYQLPFEILHSDTLEQALAPVYSALHVPPGQIQALTGVRERRVWPAGTPLWQGAVKACDKALANGETSPEQIEMLLYCGVCRDWMEPSTACSVANDLGISGRAEVLDVSNACLGLLNGILHAANAIELGQIKRALVVSCESSQNIIDLTIQRMIQNPTMELFKDSLATMTGGSGAVALLLTHKSIAGLNAHKLRGGVSFSAPKWHELCQWGHVQAPDRRYDMTMRTDAPAALQNGLVLALNTWTAFLEEMQWSPEDIDRLICHQVGEGHRAAILKAINMPIEKDYSTFEFLGNIGTVSLPISAAIADERGFLRRGDKVSFLGIGSGLNCMMLGCDW